MPPFSMLFRRFSLSCRHAPQYDTLFVFSPLMLPRAMFVKMLSHNTRQRMLLIDDCLLRHTFITLL